MLQAQQIEMLRLLQAAVMAVPLRKKYKVTRIDAAIRHLPVVRQYYSDEHAKRIADQYQLQGRWVA